MMVTENNSVILDLKLNCKYEGLYSYTYNSSKRAWMMYAQ